VSANGWGALLVRMPHDWALAAHAIRTSGTCERQLRWQARASEANAFDLMALREGVEKDPGVDAHLHEQQDESREEEDEEDICKFGSRLA
jgi:hypothetical protein